MMGMKTYDASTSAGWEFVQNTSFEWRVTLLSYDSTTRCIQFT